MTDFFPEILSPAGNEDMLIAAVRTGADAVYLGAKQFSARRNAVNFSLEELKKAVIYCHIRKVKVYLTLNILIRDDEMEEAFSLAAQAYRAGIDGLIIADLGLARCLRLALPDLPLHASTQMTVLGPAALPELKQMGFTRVVAPRELSKSELADFCAEARKLSLEVEVFVHGALCMSVSGQCLLSAFLGGRSGNRGLCAGPCRLPFAAPGGTGYDLSLKDLSLLPYLNELKELGVASFKIEGRMKRPEYVAAATAAAKAVLRDGHIPESLANALQGVFSRSGFTAGYWEEKRGKAMFGIRTKEDVIAGSDALPLLHELTRRERQSVPVSVQVEMRTEKPVIMTLSDGNNQVTVSGEIPQKALQKAVTAEGLRTTIDKFGSTPYYLSAFQAEIEEGLFLRQSELNDLRRQATERLDALRGAVSTPAVPAGYSPSPFAPCLARETPKLYLRIEETAQLPDRHKGIDAVIFPLEKEWNADFPGEKIVEIPRGFIKTASLIHRLQEYRRKGFTGALCEDMASMAAAKQCGFSILAGSGMNLLNREVALTASELGAKRMLLSAEMTAAGLKRFSSPIPYGITVYGQIPLMLFRNCPLKNGRDCDKCDRRGFLTDRKEISFPVRCRMGCSELYNSVPIWLADKQKELCGLSFEVLYCTGESKERIAEMIQAFQNEEKPDIPYTRGLLYRETR